MERDFEPFTTEELILAMRALRYYAAVADRAGKFDTMESAEDLADRFEVAFEGRSREHR